ncbi:hypothetical protein [Nocardioides sp.]|uniref:hypothetical protein n=1 Tax=Nocardioides sp. TaxID=35761 RepID=UPI0039E284E7
MFGLTFEKLFLVAVIAGFVIGPQRLPHYTQKLAETVRALRRTVDAARSTAERDIGVSLQGADWDLRHYDPRRIVRDALREDPATPVPAPVSGPDHPSADLLEEARRVRPGQKYLVSGSSAHPRRILIESLPVDDPRRVAAQVAVSPGPSEGTGTDVGLPGR